MMPPVILSAKSAMTTVGRRKFIMAAAPLLVAVSIAVLPWLYSNDERRISRPLSEIVPMKIVGWEVRTLDVAESPEMRATVARILQYDDVVFRSFRRNGSEVQIYAAYWKPGSVPYGQAGAHTPDTCWVTAGWKMEKKTTGLTATCGGRLLKPTELRQFTMRGTPLNVMFWHLVGGHVHTYQQYGWRDGLAGMWERLPNYLRDLARYGFNTGQEQVFLRISATQDFGALLEDAAFVSLLETLAPLQIFQDPRAGGGPK